MSDPADVAIRADRLIGRVAAFAALGATPAGGVNRPALGAADRAARRLLADLARARGFSVHQDEAANLFVRREGLDPALPPLLIGSHLDSQPTGGRYDGALGTLTAFEVLEALEDAGASTARAVELVAFTNEEGSRFAPGCMGSMAFSGAGRIADWLDREGTDGARLGDELALTLAALDGVEIRPVGHPVAGFVELHIEQGPLLEDIGVPIGVVTAVQGTRWLEVTVTGEAAHAGTTPLAFRRDPLAAAAAAISDLHETVMPNDPLARLTVGRIEVEPGSVNVIPAAARFTVDVRHPDAAALGALEARVEAGVRAAADRHRCRVDLQRRLDMRPERFAASVTAAIAAAAAELGIATVPMVSGAFHDALYVARVAPAAMIFVPCRGGISHNEAEFVEDRHIATGARVLARTVQALAGAGVTAG